MKRIIQRYGLLLLVLLTMGVSADGQTVAGRDSQVAIDSVMRNVVNRLLPGHNTLLRPLPYYDCVRYDHAGLHFPAGCEAHDRFYERMDSLLLFHSRSVNVWHIGGSHVQADFFSHRMRSNLVSMQPGNIAVRGALFPYDMARTNYNHNYRMAYEGSWATGRNVQRDVNYRLGLTGIAASTADTLSSLTLVLNVGQTPSWQFDRLRILGYASVPDSLCLYAINSHDGVLDTLRATTDDALPGWVLPMPSLSDSATVFIRQPRGASFTLTGLVPENDLVGINYWSSGINGAAVPSWLRCTDLGRDLALVRPDLAVFAIGINDAAVNYGDFDAEAFKAGYRRIISMIERVSPGCAYVFVTNNDTYRRVSRRVKRANPNALLVQKAFYELAEEYGGAVWDVFDLMGGLDSCTRWRDAGLMATDLIHFTRTGYELLGDLLYNALIDDYMNRVIDVKPLGVSSSR